MWWDMTNTIKSGNASGRHKDIERALHNVLAIGPSALPQQIQYILALAQLHDARPDQAQHRDRGLSAGESRISTLIRFAGALDLSHRQRIYSEIKRITDDGTRLSLTLDMLDHIPHEVDDALLNDIYETAETLHDPDVRATVLIKLAQLVPETAHEDETMPHALADALTIASRLRDMEARLRALSGLAPYLPHGTAINVFSKLLYALDVAKGDSMRANALYAISDQLPVELHERALNSAQEINSPAERARALTALLPHCSGECYVMARHEVLQAIDAIPDEIARADAIVKLVANMQPDNGADDVPDGMDDVLALTRSLTRRPARARALTALAPYLPANLQQEALTLISNLEDEQERADLLAAITPYLPDNLRIAALAVAHTMVEEDARVTALTALAGCAPSQAAAQTCADALAAAETLQRPYERATALGTLLSQHVLSETETEQARRSALDAVGEISNKAARARALVSLAAFLPATALQEALDTAYAIDDTASRINALLGLVAYIDGPAWREIVSHVMESMTQMPYSFRQAQVIANLAPYLPTDMIPKAGREADKLEDAYDQFTAYAALVQNLDADAREPLVARAWGLINAIDDGYDRGNALLLIAPYLTEDQQPALARRALNVIRAVREPYDRASTISLLAPLLVYGESVATTPALRQVDLLQSALEALVAVPGQVARQHHMRQFVPLWEALPSESRYKLWQSLGWQLTRLPLADVLLLLGEISPVLASFGIATGEEDRQIIKEIAHVLGLR